VGWVGWWRGLVEERRYCVGSWLGLITLHVRLGKCLLLLAERGDVPTGLDDPLTAVVVLVQFVAEGLKDGLKSTGRLGGSHIGIRFGMQAQILAFPGSFGAH